MVGYFSILPFPWNPDMAGKGRIEKYPTIIVKKHPNV
jgi:hypothetical protein